MKSGATQENSNELVLSFLAVRQALGWLGLFLPASLILVGLISGDGIGPTISDHYYTRMGDIFVGTLAAIGVFLWAYTGYAPKPGERISDRLISRLAAVGAFGVAFIPTGGPAIKPCSLLQCALGDKSPLFHYGFAGLLLLALAIFCLVLFPRCAPGKPVTPEKHAQIRLYRTCGTIILAAIAAIGTYALYARTLPPEAFARMESYDIVFWLETAAIFAFALSWMTKGKTLTTLKAVVRRVM